LIRAWRSLPPQKFTEPSMPWPSQTNAAMVAAE
jgi:hypothetical protein